jgi:hypothetical protein
MTPRTSLAVKIAVPVVALAAVAATLRVLPRPADGELTSAEAAHAIQVRSGRAGEPMSASQPQTETVKLRTLAGVPSVNEHVSRPDEQEPPEEAEAAEPGSDGTAAARSPWWWPFGERARAPKATGGATVSSVFAAPVAQSATTKESSGELSTLEFIGINRSGHSVPGATLSVEHTRDLKIRVWWSLTGQHVQRIELLSPDGSLYQRVQTAFDADAVALQPRGNQMYMSVETVLPIAGTWITDHSLFGDWTVNVYLDDAQTPFTSGTFSVSS